MPNDKDNTAKCREATGSQASSTSVNFTTVTGAKGREILSTKPGFPTCRYALSFKHELLHTLFKKNSRKCYLIEIPMHKIFHFPLFLFCVSLGREASYTTHFVKRQKRTDQIEGGPSETPSNCHFPSRGGKTKVSAPISSAFSMTTQEETKIAILAMYLKKIKKN